MDSDLIPDADFPAQPPASSGDDPEQAVKEAAAAALAASSGGGKQWLEHIIFNLSSSILGHGTACESASEILGSRCSQLSRRISRLSRSFLRSSSAWVSRLTMLWYNRTQQCDHFTNQICIIAQTK